MSETSLSLLERACSGADGDSWKKLAAIYTPILRRWLRQSGLQSSDEDDLVQETLLVVARELRHFRHNGRRGAFRTWLRGIAVNRLRTFWRNRGNRSTPGGSDFQLRLDQLEDPHSELSQLWDEEFERQLLLQLLAIVGPRFAERSLRAFRRVAIDGVPASEAADELGMTLNAVLIAKCRVIKELRREGNGLLGD